MFSDAEIQEVCIHCPFVRVLTISYRNRSIVMKIICTEKSYTQKLCAQKESYTTERSYAYKSYAHKIICSEKS